MLNNFKRRFPKDRVTRIIIGSAVGIYLVLFVISIIKMALAHSGHH